MIKTHLIELNEIYVATMADADRLEIALNQVSDKLGEEWRTVQLTSVCVYSHEKYISIWEVDPI